ncbi:TetR/AcrR family transcriptional regulator [Williamsia sp. SKLECPSW1]
MVKRSYVSTRRAATAAQTRTRILDAAHHLFVERGYSATTLKQIADAAGVSVQSVHLAGSKASLMTAVLERAFTGDEKFVSLLARPEFAAIMADPDTDRALDRYVDHIVTANSRIADTFHAATLAADSDPSIGQELERSELRRLDDIHTGSVWFVQRGLVGAEDVGEFADVLSYLTSPQTYRYFTVDRAWDCGRFTTWLRRSIASHLTPTE